jgi:hypothetical protein
VSEFCIAKNAQPKGVIQFLFLKKVQECYLVAKKLRLVAKPKPYTRFLQQNKAFERQYEGKRGHFHPSFFAAAHPRMYRYSTIL